MLLLLLLLLLLPLLLLLGRWRRWLLLLGRICLLLLPVPLLARCPAAGWPAAAAAAVWLPLLHLPHEGRVTLQGGG